MVETAVLLGVATGAVLGLTGAGGSVFAVPLLMTVLGWSLPQAAPVALIAVCAAATFGTVVAWDVAYVRYRAAMLIALAGIVMAPLGLKAASLLPGPALTLVFAGVLAVVAARLIFQALRSPAETLVVRATVAGSGDADGGPLCLTDPETGRLVWTRRCGLAISGAGAVTGFLSGLLGVGGGFVIVPALRAVTPLSVHSAVATSLMAIALTSFGTVVVTFLMTGSLPWAVAIPFASGSLAGMLAGRKIAPYIAGPALQHGFAALMLAAAIVLALRATR